MMRTVLFKIYRIRRARLRRLIIQIIGGLEGGEFRSRTLRDLFQHYHKLTIGLYSHGGCFQLGQFDRNTEIGRYCSIASSACAFNRNHPMDYKSTHAFFFNRRFGYIGREYISYTPLVIGHDVWIGHNAIILPNTRSIGTGAVIGAGSVVNKDVPPYAVMVGNPARLVRYRFSREKIDELLKSKWWEKDIEDLVPHIDEFMTIVEPEGSTCDRESLDGNRVRNTDSISRKK